MKPKIPKIERRFIKNVSHTRTEKDISDTLVYAKSHEDSIASIDALLKKREIMEVTGETKDKVVQYAVDKIEQGKAIFDGFKHVNGTDEAQLKVI
jgi:hypothetical protein